MNADFFRTKGWIVKERDYGTRVYREMFTLFDQHDEPYIEVRRAPSQSEDSKQFFEPYSCHLRLVNAACYDSECVAKLQMFINTYNYTFKKIFRIDICNDFVKFDDGTNPQDFLRRYMKGRYSKVNQTNLGAYGTDTWTAREWNSLSWGKKGSMVSTKFYNKTLELQQAKDKPYIRFAWFLAGLVDNPIDLTKKKADGTVYTPEVWRVEFSIRSSAKRWFKVEDKSGKKTKEDFMPNTLDAWLMPELRLTIFESLAQHYFHFKHYKQGVRKDRCLDKVTFAFQRDDSILQIARVATAKPKTNKLGRLSALLEEYKNVWAGTDAAKACVVLINDIKRAQVADMSVDRYSRALTTLIQQAIAFRIHHPETPKINLDELRAAAEELHDFF